MFFRDYQSKFEVPAMNKRNTYILIFIIVVIIGIVIYFQIESRIPYNDDNVAGNTAGNLNNGGTFCEDNGILYFSNPYDGNKLYSMNSDCTNAKTLIDDHVSSINVHGNYIYYIKNNSIGSAANTALTSDLTGIFRCDLEGKKVVSLYDNISSNISLCGNYIYYQHNDKKTASSLYKIKINKSDNKLVSKSDYNPSSYYNGKIYFSSIKDNHNIYTLDTKTNSISMYYSGNTSFTDMEGAYLYYIDIDKGSSLVRLNTENKTIELLSLGHCLNYNVYGSKLFFLKDGDDAGLYRMNIDGSNLELIASGNFNNVQCTSKYTFFQYFNKPDQLYRVSTTGAIIAIEQITIK